MLGVDDKRFALVESTVSLTMVLVIFLAAISCFLREQTKLMSLRVAVVSEPFDAWKVKGEDDIFAIAYVDGKVF